MQMTQIKDLVNAASKQTWGETAIQLEDLTNVVDVGNAIFDTESFDHYCRSLIDQIGRVVFVNRVYSGSAPNIKKDSWEYGAVLQKIHSEIPEAEVNEAWQLQEGVSYDPHVFKPGKAVSKFYNKSVTFEIDRSITHEQLKSAFRNENDLNAFISMSFNEIEKSFTIKTDALIMNTIGSLIVDTVHDDYGTAQLNTKSGVKAINVLKEYNDENSTSLTLDEALKTPGFLKYVSYRIGVLIDRLKTASKLYNVGGTVKFTPRDKLHVVMLSDFENASKVWLESDTYNKDLVSLPKHETVAFWQGSGEDYSLSNVSKINLKSGSGNQLEVPGVLCTMFDDEACGVYNEKDYVGTEPNNKARFVNYFYQKTMQYWNDLNENCVVIFAA